MPGTLLGPEGENITKINCALGSCPPGGSQPQKKKKKQRGEFYAISQLYYSETLQSVYESYTHSPPPDECLRVYPCQGELCFNKSTERQKSSQNKKGIHLCGRRSLLI